MANRDKKLLGIAPCELVVPIHGFVAEHEVHILNRDREWMAEHKPHKSLHFYVADITGLEVKGKVESVHDLSLEKYISQTEVAGICVDIQCVV